MKPSPTDINRALKSIQYAELPEDHPRVIARKVVEKWRSDAEQEQLPITNIHDDKGAPVLDRDAVLRRSYPNHTRRQ